MLENVRIVLIKTWHSGNIGAVARAMKNMGVGELYLVDPVSFPSEEATSRAGQATDILQSATVVATLSEAIEDCSLVIGTSARDRSIKLPSLTPENCAYKALSEQATAPVAIVFGRERTGLLNDEIQQCHFQVNIDANPAYPVLNLSQAVQIICYELYKASQVGNAVITENEYPRQKELTNFLEHLNKTAHEINFINTKHPGQTLDHLQAMFRRARMTRKELSIMRGLLSAIDGLKRGD